MNERTVAWRTREASVDAILLLDDTEDHVSGGQEENLYVLPEEIKQFLHWCIHIKLLNLFKSKDQKSDLHSIGTVPNMKTSLAVLKEKNTFKNGEVVCRLKLH